VKTTALAGGVGGAKLLRGLDSILPAGDLTTIVNVGDDDDIYGVRVSPDIDIVTYWLAGIADTDRGWGIKDDTFVVVDALAELGQDTWFRLGDRDFATCLYRTERLRAGATLSVVTDDIRTTLGIGPRILPASDDPIRTKVETADGRTLDFQEYFVKERQKPEVTGVVFGGAGEAKPGPDVLAAIRDADLVVVCPSNPILSVEPILSIRGIRDALRLHPRVVAVTPIIRGAALKGPADRILRSMGIGGRAADVARIYADFIDTFVVDQTDASQVQLIQDFGVRAVALDTLMVDKQSSIELARSVVEL
jgi:LPPG:FO 2-phospho-L-lactate transferase